MANTKEDIRAIIRSLSIRLGDAQEQLSLLQKKVEDLTEPAGTTEKLSRHDCERILLLADWLNWGHKSFKWHTTEQGSQYWLAVRQNLLDIVKAQGTPELPLVVPMKEITELSQAQTALSCSFDWVSTPQGWRYWSDVYDNMKNAYRNQNTAP